MSKLRRYTREANRSSGTLASQKKKEIIDKDSLPSCNVCLDNYNSTNLKPMVLNCGHTFCAECLAQINPRLCPTCRQAYTRTVVNFTLIEQMEFAVKMLAQLSLAETKDQNNNNSNKNKNKANQPVPAAAAVRPAAVAATAATPAAALAAAPAAAPAPAPAVSNPAEVGEQGKTNLYIKKLNYSVTDAQLKTMFLAFGTITSAKVATDDNGASKGVGFVNFENAADAAKAIEMMHGKPINSKSLYVAYHQSKNDRVSGPAPKPPTPEENVMSNYYNYVYYRNHFMPGPARPNIPPYNGGRCGFSRRKPPAWLRPNVAPPPLPSNQPVQPSPSLPPSRNAQRPAKSRLDDRVEPRIAVQTLTQAGAQAQRQRAITPKTKGTNLLVDNLDKNVGEGVLKLLFESHGKVGSAMIVKDDKKQPAGYGFVHFSNPLDAERAMKAMNNTLIGNKYITVTEANK